MTLGDMQWHSSGGRICYSFSRLIHIGYSLDNPGEVGAKYWKGYQIIFRICCYFLQKGGHVGRWWVDCVGTVTVCVGGWCGRRGEYLPIFIWRTFNHEGIFRQDDLRWSYLQQFVPYTDSALILFDLKCHKKKKNVPR